MMRIDQLSRESVWISATLIRINFLWITQGNSKD